MTALGSTEIDFETYSRKRVHRPSINVLLDARKLEDGGIGVYIQNLIAGLSQQREVTLSLITQPGAANRNPAIFAGARAKNIIEDRARSYSLDEMFGFARRIDTAGYDLYHSPHYTLPFGLKIPTVVTVHDLIHVHFPQRVYYPLIARPLIRSALRRATRVMTVSEASCYDLRDLMNLEGEAISKIKVIPNAVDPVFFRPLPEPAEIGAFLARRFKVDGDYLLAVLSNSKPHKGLADLLGAFARIHSAFPNLKLVLIGKGSPENLSGTGIAPEVQAQIRSLGFVGREEMVQLYAACRALVVASRTEGFCLPVIEARALGVPVVARPVPAVLELLSAEDFVCQDFTIGSLVEGVTQCIEHVTSGEDAAHFHSGDSSLADKYRAENVARCVVDVYYEAIEECRAGS